MLTVSEAWKTAYPEATAGVLVMRDVVNPPSHPRLDRRIAECERDLRARFQGSDRATLKLLPALEAYAAHYKRYRKTYHVQLQLDSVLKGKPIPRGPALVAAMVTAELAHLLLTAGHDLEAIELPITLAVAAGHERYRLLDGREQAVQADDMMMIDRQGVISSVLYGPDQRTCLRPATRQVMFAVYAPAGIGEGAVIQHLQELRSTVLLFSPGAEVETLQAYGTT